MNRPYPSLYKYQASKRNGEIFAREENDLLRESIKLIREYNQDEVKFKLIPLDNCPRCGKVIRVDRFNYMRHLYNCVKARRRYRI